MREPSAGDSRVPLLRVTSPPGVTRTSSLGPGNSAIIAISRRALATSGISLTFTSTRPE